MAFLEQQQVEIAPQNLDAGGRVRVSQVTSYGDYRFTHLNNALQWDFANGGTGAGALSGNGFVLSTAVINDYAIKQTKMFHPYLNGKSTQIDFSCSGFGDVIGITKRIGYFSTSTVAPYTANADGVFLSTNGNTHSIQIWRDGANVLSVNQSAWDDPLDGTGDSGVTINWNNFNAFTIDFLWLGGTRVRFGLINGDSVYWFHTYYHSNTTTNTVFLKPNKPLRYEIRSTVVGANTFTGYCFSANSEGYVDDIGAVRSVSNGTTAITPLAVGTYYALLGIRLRSGFEDIFTELLKISMISNSTDDIHWQIRLNPTVAGAFTYADMDTNTSAMQLATGVITNTVTGGTLISSGYYKGNTSIIDVQKKSAIRLGSTINGTMDTLVLCATTLTINSSIHGSMDFRELI